jgi:hypothetical protein
VVEFFETLRAIEFHRFHPVRLFETDNVVVALINLEATVRATGKRVVEEDEAHIWYFDSQGKVSRFRHRVDTLQHSAAFNGK